MENSDTGGRLATCQINAEFATLHIEMENCRIDQGDFGVKAFVGRAVSMMNAAKSGGGNAILRSDGVLAVVPHGHACQRTTARTPSPRKITDSRLNGIQVGH